MTWELEQRLREIRHHIHRHPELSGAEHTTTAYIRSVLGQWEIPVCPSSLETGLVAELGSRDRGPVIALRADIDALPIEEKTGLPYASEIPGCMHACGHDFHLTALLGAAWELKRRQALLPGLVRLIFQPGEEAAWGSRQVIAAGHLEDVQAILGFHSHPHYPVGTIALREGAMMAAADQFRVRITGGGCHAAQPHLGTDVITAMSAILLQLQTVVSRNVAPNEAAVLSVTRVAAGESWNTLPDEALFQGTARSFSAEVRALLEARARAVIASAGQAYGLQTEVSWSHGPGATCNDPALTREVASCSGTFARVVPAEPSNGGEDFSSYLERVPGVFAFIGTNGDPNAPGWHRSDFLVKDEALPVAVRYYVDNALHLLDRLRSARQ